jgi:hypothetical protein
MHLDNLLLRIVVFKSIHQFTHTPIHSAAEALPSLTKNGCPPFELRLSEASLDLPHSVSVHFVVICSINAVQAYEYLMSVLDYKCMG